MSGTASGLPPNLPPLHALPAEPDLRVIRRELVNAPDEQVLAVLRLVDDMADRGRADSLLAPLRERLRVLRPARPLRLSRLLFMPMDPVIVQPNEWRAGQPLLPRSAIAPLTALLRAALPAQAEAVEHAILRQVPLSEAELLALGAMLWPAAAKVLRGVAAAPPDWREAGLREADFLPLCQACATLLALAPALVELGSPATPPAELDAQLKDMLAQAEAAGALGWGMVLTVVLQRFPKAEAPRRAAALPRADRAMKLAAELAQERGFAWVEAAAAAPAGGDLRAAAEAAIRQVALVEKSRNEPGQARRANELAAVLRDGLAAQLEASVQAHLVGRLRPAAPTGEALALDVLEEDARALKRLEAEVRRLSKGNFADPMRPAVEAVAGRADLSAMERARLIEILQGTEAAVAFLAKV